MRRLRYGVATSLDGFIAGPNGEYDWIIRDPAIDFVAMFAQYDTLLMGRKTYEVASSAEHLPPTPGQRWIVVSTTMKPEDHPGITILSSGVLFRSLLDAGLVDTVEVELIPVMIGSGTPLLPEGRRRPLHLTESKTLPSGILMLKYSIVPEHAG